MLNGQAMKEILNKNETAKAVTQSLAERQRMRRFSDLGRFKRSLINKGLPVVEDDYTQYWKDLEKQGVGSIIYGRRGNSDRFKWHYSLKNVAKFGDDIPFTDNPEQLEPQVIKRSRGRPKGSKNKKKRGRPVKMLTLSSEDKQTIKDAISVLNRYF